MNLHELDRYKLSDAVKFNARLNPKLWGQDEHLKPQVRDALMKIADDFRESLGVKDLDLKDITLSGSNAAYTYTPNSDIDLHLVVDIPDDEVYRELFDAKKYAYNNQHNIKIGGYDVELYVQDVDQPHVTQGEYSLLRNDWIQVPRRQRADVVDQSTRSKYQDLKQRIKDAIKTQDHDVMADLMTKIRQLRQSGLDEHGEFGPENLAFKMLRTQGYIQRLVDARNAAKDQELSIDERAKPHVTYGFTTESEDGLQDTINQFAKSCIDYLGIKKAPEIKLHTSTNWSEQTGSFGQYEPDANVLHLATAGRHTLDILRTMAHEFTHRKQAEKETLPDDAGETGSPYEDEANAMAGRIMRHWAEKHPEMFAHVPLEEASGYIPTKKQARDPRYSMALTVDIKPGQVGKEANKLNLKTNRQGIPQVAKANGLFEKLALELDNFKEQDLFEINMGSKNLRREAARTGAIAGMEFEMIVPNVEGGGDEDQEPNYDYDQRCRSIQDAYDFFYDGDWNSRRSCDEMRDSMRNDYTEWLDEKISLYWDSGGEEYIAEWVKNNVDESEWNPDDLEGEARNGALEEYATNVHADPVSDQYQTAYEEFREENQESYDESDWLDDADLSRMSEIENAYSMSWPHWQSQGGGEASIEDIAQEFENSIGRDVRASGNYHSGSIIRPSPTQIRYVVEPDGSLEPDNPGDQGLEFVSPPLPIDEILGDLNKVKAWAKEYGCYTNDSTGLHINISVPGYSRQNLDFVKLALLMGDKYVLSTFGRSGNTYAKSALDIVKKAVRDNPDNAAALLDKMKGNLDQLASKAIHSGITSKYTSINTKDGHIEFRSPGGDWLDQNFDQIENTLLRFTVAMSAALNPDMYRQEYLTKLYKMLTENNRDDDTIKYFSDYVAGKIPKAALRSFVKQAQLQRNIRRGKTDGQKMWWKVYKDGKNAGRYGAMIEVVATSEKEAIDKAAKEWGLFSQEYKSQMDAEPLRPYEEKPGSGTYELFDRRTGETIPDTEFSARNQEDVNTRVDDYINFGQHGLSTVDARLLFGARPVAAPADEPDQGPSANSLRPTGPGPWEIYNRATGNSVMNLMQNSQPIADRAQAQRFAMALISTGRHDLYGVRTVGTDTTTNIGTQTDMENRLGLPSQSATANYAVVDRQTLDPVFRFQAGNLRDANGIYGEWLAATGLPATTEDYGFQEIRPGQPEEAESSLWAVRRISDDNSQPMGPTLTIRARDEQAARDQVRRDYPEYEFAWLDVQPAEANAVPEVPMDVAQNFPDRTDGRNIDYSFRDLFGNTDQASSAPAGNSFSGQWRVMIDGEEVWRFRGVGNSQIDANRIAQTWLQDQRSQRLLSPAPGADIEVVPVMTEGLTEYKNTPLQDYNGLQFMIDSNHPYLRVKAFAPGSGQQLAQVDFKIDDQDELHPEDLHVEERWRGQGIAKVMYDYVKSQGYTIHRSWSQTDAGSEFWNKHRGQKRVWEQGVAESKLIESAVFLNPTTVIVGQAHGQPLELSPDTLKKIQDIAAKHGAWYEGNGTDRAYTKGQIDRYVGSWDDDVAKNASPNDPKWLYVLFSNVDANNRVQRVGVDPKDTIFNRLLATAQDNSFQGIGYTSQALQKFLQMSSEGKYDFVKMSQQPATQENLTRFLKAGESLMWPNNWEQYPNRAGKIAKAATVDVRDQYLATREAGVYVTGSGHLKAVQNITGKQGVAEDAQLPGDFKLMGQNLFLKNLARNLKQRYPDATVKLSSDRVTAYHNEGDDEALTVMGTEVMDSGYIGVGLDDAFTESFQGVLVPTIKQTTEQLLAANPGTRPALFLSTDNWNPDAWTHIADKLGYRLVADDESLDEQGVAESENNDTAISLSKLGKFHPGADSLAEFVPERATARYALHPDKWESTFYSLTNKDSDKLKYYGPKRISIPPGTLVGDMAIANKFYRAKTPEEKQQYAELYKASLQPYPVDVSAYRMPELLIPRQGMAEEQLDELFQPGKQNWAWKYKADNEAIAKFTVGDRDYVWQAFNHFRDDKPHKWEIQFRVVKQSTDPEKLQVYGTTGTGNSAEVMSNAVDIMREFLQYYGDGVQQIAFDAKENSRIALYRKMIQRLLPNWNADEDYSPEYGLRFTLTRPKSTAQGLSEARNSLFAFVKQQFPTWPDYVLKDFLYQQAKGIRDQAELDDFLKRNKQDFGNCKWTLTKLPITFDIFTPKTQRMLASREGGSSNPFQVPRDAERHALQSQMIQQKGVSAEPIIVAKLSNGYDLIEGWHRTIQHLKAFPQGYTGPAWVCTGATYKSESVDQGVAQGSDLQEIATMPADQFAGGKDMLDYMPPPSKKRLRPLPGGTDLMYAIETMGPETRVQIVDPGVPGITRPVVVAVLNLDPSSLPNTVQVGSITVDEDYRGRGLAKSLYGIVLTIMRKNLVSGDSQTPGGRRNWLSLATIPGVEVRGLVRIPNQIFDLERSATVTPQWRKYADRTIDQVMELGGQFYSKDNHSSYWLFDVVPGKTSLKPAVQNALSQLYGYESDNLLLATWTGA